MSHGRQPEVECFLFWRGFAPYNGQENSCFNVCVLTLQTRWPQNAPKREKYNFRLTSVAQKRLCLSSLLWREVKGNNDNDNDNNNDNNNKNKKTMKFSQNKRR